MCKYAIVFPGSASSNSLEFSKLDDPEESLLKKARQILKGQSGINTDSLSNAISQVDQMILNYSSYSQIKQQISISLIIGLSSGQLTGALAANMLSFENAITLAFKFASVEESLHCINEGALMIIDNVSLQAVKNLLPKNFWNKLVFLAANNAPHHFVLGVDNKALAKVISIFQMRHIDLQLLTGMAPFHTPLMKRGRLEIETALNNQIFNSPETAFISDYDNDLNSEYNFKQKLIEQDFNPSNLLANVLNATHQGIQKFIVPNNDPRLTMFLKDIGVSVLEI